MRADVASISLNFLVCCFPKLLLVRMFHKGVGISIATF